MTTIATLLLLAGCGSGADSAVPAALITAAMPAHPARVQAGTAAHRAPTTDFAAFRTRFRAAALSGDAATLKTLSAASVRAHGELDDDPPERLGPAHVPAALARLTASKEPLDPQGRTLRALIQSEATLLASDRDGTGQQRIGDFVFEPDKSGNWHLTDLYVGSDE